MSVKSEFSRLNGATRSRKTYFQPHKNMNTVVSDKVFILFFIFCCFTTNRLFVTHINWQTNPILSFSVQVRGVVGGVKKPS